MDRLPVRLKREGVLVLSGQNAITLIRFWSFLSLDPGKIGACKESMIVLASLHCPFSWFKFA